MIWPWRRTTDCAQWDRVPSFARHDHSTAAASSVASNRSILWATIPWRRRDSIPVWRTSRASLGPRQDGTGCQNRKRSFLPCHTISSLISETRGSTTPSSRASYAARSLSADIHQNPTPTTTADQRPRGPSPVGACSGPASAIELEGLDRSWEMAVDVRMVTSSNPLREPKQHQSAGVDGPQP